MSTARTRKKQRGGVRKGAGRPALPPGEVRDVRLAIRITTAEAKTLEMQATADGISVADLVRQRLGLA